MSTNNNELVVLVDNNSKPIGTQTKEKVHHANTPLHLAFSCYLFNDGGKLLLTKRASVKKVWPNVWTNSFCGHPMPDEPFDIAIKRRAKHELGINKLYNITKVIDYRYKTPPYNGIIENEICPIFVAFIHDNQLALHPHEVDGLEWVDKPTYQKYLKSDNLDISYWLTDQAKKMQSAGVDIFDFAKNTKYNN